MEPNPYAVLSLIVAPAILTNASSVIIMSTSNRLARSVDRARELSKQLEAETQFTSEESKRRLRELSATERRTLLLLRGLRSFYVALACFAMAALLSLFGALLVPVKADMVIQSLEVAGVAAGMLAVTALVHGSFLLFHETRIAVTILSERVATVRARAER